MTKQPTARWDRAFVGFRLLTACDNGAPYGLIDDGVVGVKQGKIVWVSPRAAADRANFGADVVEGYGRCLSPGLIDCHTHLIYGGQRIDEWEQRLRGVRYEEIAQAGGGIASTVAATRAATEDELYASARDRIQRLMSEGVTTFEIKSGYGLERDSELKMLRLAGDLGKSMPIDVSRTLLAAHALPAEFRGRSDDYIQSICHEVLPSARPHCDAVDAFCEPIAFSWSQCARLFEAARDAGLGFKIHAEQLSHTGSAAAAAALGAWSADHLEYLRADEAPILARHGTVAVLLPGAYYFLRQNHSPPVKALRESGAVMAVATDSNPGSSPVQSLLLMMNMACTLFGLTPEETFRGVTIAAAKALRREDRIGSIAVGKQADLVVWNLDSPAELSYALGANPCQQVYKRGELVIDHS
jgi:imidazolonepropionase